MKIEINIEKKIMIVLLAAICIVLAIPLIIASPGVPYPVGHSWDQIECDNNFCVNLTAGGVGIGTANPSQALEVDGAFIMVSPSAGSSSAGLRLVGQDGRDWRLVSTGSADPDGAGLFQINDASAPADRLTIDSSGNVGIGTASPAGELHVKSLGISDVIIDSTNANQNLWFRNNGVDTFAIEVETDGDALFSTRSSTADMMWRVGSPLSTVMTLTDAGRLGIGTTSPTEMLELYNPLGTTRLKLTANSAYYTYLENNYNAANPFNLRVMYGNILSAYDSAARVYINSPTSAAGRGVGLQIAGNTKLWVDASGNVGIGTAIPGAYKLNVAGDTITDTLTIVGGAALPSCTSSYRGKMFLLQSGAGVEDGLYACKKQADDTYNWNALASPPPPKQIKAKAVASSSWVVLGEFDHTETVTTTIKQRWNYDPDIILYKTRYYATDGSYYELRQSGEWSGIIYYDIGGPVVLRNGNPLLTGQYQESTPTIDGYIMASFVGSQYCTSCIGKSHVYTRRADCSVSSWQILSLYDSCSYTLGWVCAYTQEVICADEFYDELKVE